MNESHQSTGHPGLAMAALAAGWPVRAAARLRAPSPRWLVVERGRAWVTRTGDPLDHVLDAPARIWLERGQAVVAEPWHGGVELVLRWQPGRPSAQDWRARLRAGGAAVLRGAAEGLRAVAAGLGRWARSAEAMASRAQGSICAGDSIASCGAVQ